MKKKYIWVILVVLLLIGGIVGCIKIYKDKINNTQNTTTSKVEVVDGFEYNLLREVNKSNNDSFLISPYSIKYALMLLRDGAKGDTYDEIAKVVGQEKGLHMDNDYVKVANALFLKNQYKEYFNSDYTEKFLYNTNASIIYDDFRTPAAINNWTNEKTDGMINNVLNNIEHDFVLGVANALAIDVKWRSQFECENTASKEFTKIDGTKKKVSMMNKIYEGQGQVTYVESDDAKGIVIPYEDETNLEYIAILPNNNVKDYISNFNEEKFNTLLNNKKESSNKLHINLSMPRFKYDYELNDFSKILNNLGIKKAFEPNNADFTNFMTKDNMTKSGISNLYVSQSVHKTYIDLNESGTKAAAVTFFGLSKATSAAQPEFETINIDFNKSFLYLIREKKTNEILFMGVVNNPEEWKGTTCTIEN